ncbi:hypothetical protein A3D54_00725 [Candidatus Falkowbacteria bacterium RIFCSPHIGHO2_02_FULL_45_15]|uniref:Uncharacterized protein n=1 Tax=Candidatus Falkowbacteria bacterium RIFCSPHIGHO2_02_FULL_45_15 TaxID=1797987 RepID=A0A1F5RMM4_9BACT|nr:MAG: hypothetical protein A3D54_00725 [Candidatus Falkowbacteria bacterium RIFCSPHIGHO2_02_FULL_45_15]
MIMPKKEETAAPKLNNNLKSYQPVEGPTNWQLSFGLWWVQRRALLRRVLIGVMAVVSLPLLAYGLYGLGYYFYQGILADRQLAYNLVTATGITHDFIVRRGPQNLTIGPVNILSSAGSSYDLASLAYNPNNNWYASFDYSFIVGGNKTAAQPEFILPQEKKYLTAFLHTGVRTATTVVSLTDIRWQRLAVKESEDIGQTIKERTDISVSDIKLDNSGAERGLPINSLYFRARNNSPYNYWEADFYLVAQAGGNVIGINKYRLEKFYSGETRTVNIQWPAYLGGAQITVSPSINIFDPDNYIAFELGPGQEK